MTLKRPKDKGTAGETELRRKLEDNGIEVTRTAPSSKWDLHRRGPDPIEVLAVRPDRGQWLMTVSLEDFIDLINAIDSWHSLGLRIEVKRWATSRIHTVWKEKFGG